MTLFKIHSTNIILCANMSVILYARMSDIPTILHNVRRCLSYRIWEVLIMLLTFVLFYYVAQASLERFKSILKEILHMGVLHAFLPVYHMCAWYLRKPEESIGSPGTRVTDGDEFPWEWWELNVRPLDR